MGLSTKNHGKAGLRRFLDQKSYVVCVETASFSVRVNGVLSENFIPSRGIRQADPISPYLFLLCSEGLTCLLKYVGTSHLARGVRVGIHSPGSPICCSWMIALLLRKLVQQELRELMKF